MQPRPARRLALDLPQIHGCLLFGVRFAQRDDFQLDCGKSGLGHRQLLGGGQGEINDAPLLKSASIGNANHHRPLVHGVANPNQRAKGKSWMAGGHGVHVVALSTCGMAAVESSAIPGGQAFECMSRSAFHGLMRRQRYRRRARCGDRGGSRRGQSGKRRICMHGPRGNCDHPGDQCYRGSSREQPNP